MLDMLRPDKAFVTPTSFIPGRGLMTNNQEMAELKRAFLGCAGETYVLMDSSKIDAPGLLWFGTLAGVEAVVMERPPTAPWRPLPRRPAASSSSHRRKLKITAGAPACAGVRQKAERPAASNSKPPHHCPHLFWFRPNAGASQPKARRPRRRRRPHPTAP